MSLDDARNKMEDCVETIMSSDHTVPLAKKCRFRLRMAQRQPRRSEFNLGKLEFSVAQNRGAPQKTLEQTQNWVKLGGNVTGAVDRLHI